MVSHQERNAVELMKLAPELADRRRRRQQVLRGGTAKCNHVLWSDQGELLFQIFAAIGLFLRPWLSVGWRSAFNCVANIYLVPLKPACGKNPVKKLACGTDKRFPKSILICPRRL